MKKSLFLAAFAGTCFSAFAYIWTGNAGDGRWTNPSNWGGGGYPQSSSDTAEFKSSVTVSLDSGSVLAVGCIKVDANNTVTLNGTAGSAINPVRSAAVNDNGFVVSSGGKFVLNIPVVSSGRIDKWGAGEVVFNANVTITGNYYFLVDCGTVTLQGSAVLSLTDGILGLGNNGDRTQIKLEVRDSAHVSVREIQTTVAANSSTGSGRIVQDGEGTEVTGSGNANLYGTSGTSDKGVYELKNGTFTASAVTLGKAGTGGTGGAYGGGIFAQSGGRALVANNFVTAGTSASSIDLSGGTLAFGATSIGKIGAPLNLSGSPTIELAGGNLYLPANMTIASGTSLTKTGGTSSILYVTNNLAVDGSLTVDKGYLLVGDFTGCPVEISAPVGNDTPWPVTIKNGGILQMSLINSRVTRPLSLSIENGGKIRFPYTNPYFTRSILVAHALVVDGVAQAKGRYTAANLPSVFASDSAGTASIVVPYVWTGAGDGTNWNDPANWDGNAVPSSGDGTCVDLSRAAGKSIVLDDTQTLTCIVFNPQGSKRTMTISGTGKIVHDCPSYTVGMFVGPERELVLDVNVGKSDYSKIPAIVGGGRVTVKRNFPCVLNTDSWKRASYVIDGELAFAGTTTFPSTQGANLSGFGSWENAGRSKIVFEDGCAVSAFRLDPSPIGGVISSDEWVQNGGSVSLKNFYFTRYHNNSRVPFSYTLNAGNMIVETDFCLGTAYYTSSPRYPGGSFVMNGGTLTLGTFKCQRNNNYIHLNGGDVYVDSGFVDTCDSQNQTTNDVAVKLGGATIHCTAGTWHNAVTWTSALKMELTGKNGSTTFDTLGYNAIFNNSVSGAGGFVKTGAGTLTFSGAATFSGPVVVNGGNVVFGSTVNGPTDFTVRAGTLSFQTAPSAAFESIVVPSANDIVVSASASGFQVKRLVIGGVVQAAGSVAVNGGTVNVTGTGLSVWQGPNDGTWSATANWTGDVPNGATATVDFGYSALATEASVNLDADITLKNLAYSHATDGASLTLAGSGTFSFASGGVIIVPAGNTLVIDSNVTLLGETVKKGQGTLVINGDITSPGTAGDKYWIIAEDGDVRINGAVSKCRLRIESDHANPILTVCDGAVVSNAVSVNAGWLKKMGSVVQNGGVVNLNPPSSGFVAEKFWTMTYGDGTYTLNGGTLALYENSRFGYDTSSTVKFIQNGGTLKVGRIGVNDVGNTYTYTLNGGTNEIATLWTAGASTSATAYLNGGTIVSGGNTAMFTPMVDVVFGGDVTFLQKAANVAVTLGSKMTGIGTIRQKGPGTLTLAGDHLFAGMLKAEAGTLAIAKPVDEDSTLDIATGAHVSIDCDEVVVSRFLINGKERAAGRYGAAANNPRGCLAGVGVLVVLTGKPRGTILSIK